PPETKAKPAAERTQAAGLDDKSAHRASSRGRINDDSERIRRELESLASRRSNIPSRILAVRDGMCEELGIDRGELPFAGELVDVADAHAQWRGAAERVLRGFAMSLLVSEPHYSGVSA